jgi:DNA repair protein RadA/Sms
MPSATTALRYVCRECGAISPKWEGRCNTCGEWNTFDEAVERAVAPRQRVDKGAAVTANLLSDVAVGDTVRIPTSFGEIDRVLGGGICSGSLILLGGDPGIGKSTLALALAHACASPGSPTLYCSGEESEQQLAARATRLGCATSDIAVVTQTDVDVLIATIDARRPPLAIVDSIQTAYDAAVSGVPGSPTQVREAVARLMSCAKQTAVPIVLIGHVTKEGAIAGPRTLEHMVDVVLYLEGDRHAGHRLLRGIKNRFGATGEAGLLMMTETGMRELDAGSRAFLDESSLGVSGNGLSVMCEGSRGVVVEVQALTVPTSFGLPRRTASGFDLGRLHLILAVLEKRAGIRLGQSDVYVNVVGGIRLAEPAGDLAVALAIASAAWDKALPKHCAAVGEVGLGGEIRRVRQLGLRLREAAAVGIETVIVPGHPSVTAPPGVQILGVDSLTRALGHLGPT